MRISLKQNKKIVIGTNNSIGKVTFSKVAKLSEAVLLSGLGDVNTSGQQDGDVLVYQSNTNTYAIKTLPKVDGGEF